MEKQNVKLQFSPALKIKKWNTMRKSNKSYADMSRIALTGSTVLNTTHKPSSTLRKPLFDSKMQNEAREIAKELTEYNKMMNTLRATNEGFKGIRTMLSEYEKRRVNLKVGTKYKIEKPHHRSLLSKTSDTPMKLTELRISPKLKPSISKKLNQNMIGLIYAGLDAKVQNTFYSVSKPGYKNKLARLLLKPISKNHSPEHPERTVIKVRKEGIKDYLEGENPYLIETPFKSPTKSFMNRTTRKSWGTFELKSSFENHL